MTLRKREDIAFFQSIKLCSPTQDSHTTLLARYTKVTSLANTLQMFLIIVFGLLGAMAAPIAFESGPHQHINIFWLLLILLGAHFFSLFIWLIGWFKPTTKAHSTAHTFGYILTAVGRRLGLPKDILTTYLSLHFDRAIGAWGFARLLHCCWTSYLLGGLVSALLFLATHQVQFVWETTLLTQQDFHSLTQAISTVPNWLGVPTPSVSDIALSQIGVDQQPEETRKLWALWVLACVLIYGVLIRFLCAVVCHLNYRVKRARYWLSLMPEPSATTRTTRQILDAAPSSGIAEKASTEPSTIASQKIDRLPLESALYLFEWSQAPALNKRPYETLNSASQQRAYLHATSAHKAIIIDADISPDRGSLRFMHQANATTESFYLYGTQFIDAWYQAMQQHDIAPQKIVHLKE